MRTKNLKIAKRIIEILLLIHHLLTYMEHYEIEFNHHYHQQYQHIKVVTWDTKRCNFAWLVCPKNGMKAFLYWPHFVIFPSDCLESRQLGGKMHETSDYKKKHFKFGDTWKCSYICLGIHKRIRIVQFKT